MIKVSNIKKSFGDIKAVDKVSFEVAQGETLGFLGPNGAGKTTSINMIVGITKPDSGSISINGYDDPTKAAVRSNIGNAPQKLAIYDDLTVKENLEFFGKLYNINGGRLKERISWALEFAGLENRQKDRAKVLSGGMQRRLNFACALVHDPAILVLDEPTVGVDPQSRNLIFEKIEQLQKQGRTIIYTTHYMEEAQRLCDRVAIMDYGNILALDTVDRLIDKYGGISSVTGTMKSKPEADIELPAATDGLILRFESNNPFAEINKLLNKGIEFTNLHVDRPNLEAVFLNLTGRSLRD